MKYYVVILLFIIIILGCESDDSYPWEMETTYENVLKSAGDKLVLLDFETEW